MKENILVDRFYITCILLIIYSCSDNKSTSTVDQHKSVKNSNSRLLQYNNHIYPAILSVIKSGDIVTRLGNDLTSEMLRQMNLNDKSFSHIGIASIENDTVFVYHAIGGEFNPDQKLKRETIWSFAHPDDNKKVGVFRMRMDKALIAPLIDRIHYIHSKQIPFDMDFDLTTDNRLYCAEFVGKSFEHIFKTNHFFHRSTLAGKAFIEVDDITGNQSVINIQNLDY